MEKGILPKINRNKLFTMKKDKKKKVSSFICKPSGMWYDKDNLQMEGILCWTISELAVPFPM